MGKIHRIPVLGTAFAFGGFKPQFTQDRHGSATRSVMLGGRSAMESQLLVKVIHNPDWKLRDGRIIKGVDLESYTSEELDGKQMIPGTGRERKITEYFGNKENWFKRKFYQYIYKEKTELNLGSGLITNVSQLALANDFNWPNPTTAINTLKICNYHATGTGATAAAATDIQLQTWDSVTPQAGTQTLVSAANLQKLQTVATISYTGTESVTEWSLFSSNTLSSTTGTPATASSATSLTATGTPYTASSSSVQGKTQNIVVDTAASPNVWGLITSNGTAQLNVPAWYKKTDGTAGSTPGSTDAFAIYPVMLDHKVFSTISVINGDSIQFTYLLTCATGG